MKSHTLQSVLALSAIVATGMLTSTLQAAPLYTNDFTGNTGALPTDWIKAANTPIGTISTGLFSDAFRIDEEGVATPRSYGLDPTTNGAAAWTNYTVIAPFQINQVSGTTTVASLLARWDGVTTNSGSAILNAYQLQFAIDKIYLVEGFGGSNGRGTGTTALATSVSLGTFSANTTYTLWLDLNGSNLTGRIYSGSGTGGSMLGEITATDSSLTSGSVGLGASFSAAAGREVRWDSITVVPEPSTVGLLVLGGIAAAVFRRRIRTA